MIQAVIFDVDGVLIDSVPFHFKAWQQAFSEYGKQFTFADYLEKVNGLPRLTGVQHILPELSQAEQEHVAQLKQQYLLEIVAESSLEPLPGVVDLIKQLHQENIVTAAASSSKNAPSFLQQAGIAKYMKHITTGNDFVHPKPHSDIFVTAAKAIAVNPEQVVVIEDALVGVQAAKHAQMKTVGVLTSQDSSITNVADITVSSLAEVDKIISFIKE